ncbi:hypothetical protein K438DRAFT_1910118 [Mycena galopus ATCC 62051]|nr:hypothetical protein K438DRAFT_1910118 [Mycena galopus ATCC 62051]
MPRHGRQALFFLFFVAEIVDSTKKAAANENEVVGGKSVQENTRQLGSLFLQLPLATRIDIYAHLFFSTRLVWGEQFGIGKPFASAPKALALFRACCQIHVEIDITWLQQVLFSFESPEAMLNKLANIPLATRALIRHSRVSGESLILSWMEGDVFYRTAQVVKLLPGLALDCLTVLGPWFRDVRYQSLDMLVSHGTGWKELRFLSRDSTFLAYKHDAKLAALTPGDNRYLRVPQPAGWQRALEKRDGASTSPSVTIYRATSREPCSVLLLPTIRAAFTQMLPAGKGPTTFGKEEDATLMAPGERDKEVLVVVARGRGVDYVEREKSPYLKDGHIREDNPGKTWRQIKAEQDKLFHNADDDFFSDSEDEEDSHTVEQYTHVDEYVWPPPGRS